MNIRQLSVFTVVLPVVIAAWSVLSAQQTSDYLAPRTEHNQPDLQGVWNFSSNTPMQRDLRYGEREFLTADEV